MDNVKGLTDPDLQDISCFTPLLTSTPRPSLPDKTTMSQSTNLVAGEPAELPVAPPANPAISRSIRLNDFHKKSNTDVSSVNQSSNLSRDENDKLQKEMELLKLHQSKYDQKLSTLTRELSLTQQELGLCKSEIQYMRSTCVCHCSSHSMNTRIDGRSLSLRNEGDHSQCNIERKRTYSLDLNIRPLSSEKLMFQTNLQRKTSKSSSNLSKAHLKEIKFSEKDFSEISNQIPKQSKTVPVSEKVPLSMPLVKNHAPYDINPKAFQSPFHFYVEQPKFFSNEPTNCHKTLDHSQKDAEFQLENKNSCSTPVSSEVNTRNAGAPNGDNSGKSHAIPSGALPLKAGHSFGSNLSTTHADINNDAPPCAVDNILFAKQTLSDQPMSFQNSNCIHEFATSIASPAAELMNHTTKEFESLVAENISEASAAILMPQSNATATLQVIDADAAMYLNPNPYFSESTMGSQRRLAQNPNIPKDHSHICFTSPSTISIEAVRSQQDEVKNDKGSDMQHDLTKRKKDLHKDANKYYVSHYNLRKNKRPIIIYLNRNFSSENKIPETPLKSLQGEKCSAMQPKRSKGKIPLKKLVKKSVENKHSQISRKLLKEKKYDCAMHYNLRNRKRPLNFIINRSENKFPETPLLQGEEYSDEELKPSKVKRPLKKYIKKSAGNKRSLTSKKSQQEKESNKRNVLQLKHSIEKSLEVIKKSPQYKNLQRSRRSNFNMGNEKHVTSQVQKMHSIRAARCSIHCVNARQNDGCLSLHNEDYCRSHCNMKCKRTYSPAFNIRRLSSKKSMSERNLQKQTSKSSLLSNAIPKKMKFSAKDLSEKSKSIPNDSKTVPVSETASLSKASSKNYKFHDIDTEASQTPFCFYAEQPEFTSRNAISNNALQMKSSCSSGYNLSTTQADCNNDSPFAIDKKSLSNLLMSFPSIDSIQEFGTVIASAAATVMNQATKAFESLVAETISEAIAARGMPQSNATATRQVIQSDTAMDLNSDPSFSKSTMSSESRLVENPNIPKDQPHYSTCFVELDFDEPDTSKLHNADFETDEPDTSKLHNADFETDEPGCSNSLKFDMHGSFKSIIPKNITEFSEGDCNSSESLNLKSQQDEVENDNDSDKQHDLTIRKSYLHKVTKKSAGNNQYETSLKSQDDKGSSLEPKLSKGKRPLKKLVKSSTENDHSHTSLNSQQEGNYEYNTMTHNLSKIETSFKKDNVKSIQSKNPHTFQGSNYKKTNKERVTNPGQKMHTSLEPIAKRSRLCVPQKSSHSYDFEKDNERIYKDFDSDSDDICSKTYSYFSTPIHPGIPKHISMEHETKMLLELKTNDEKDKQLSGANTLDTESRKVIKRILEISQMFHNAPPLPSLPDSDDGGL